MITDVDRDIDMDMDMDTDMDTDMNSDMDPDMHCRTWLRAQRRHVVLLSVDRLQIAVVKMLACESEGHMFESPQATFDECEVIYDSSQRTKRQHFNIYQPFSTLNKFFSGAIALQAVKDASAFSASALKMLLACITLSATF